MEQRVTICVLLYGSYPELARQAINSIVSNCDKRLYTLFVGCNACCLETLDFVDSVEQIDQKFVSSENLNKCPMQRRMFAKVNTEFVWWFDDDSHIFDADALQRRIEFADVASPSVVLWGAAFVWDHNEGFSFGIDVRPWIRSQPWYSGKSIPSDPEGHWEFAIGANWFARTSVLRQLDWPPQSFLKPGDDTLFCEAIRQAGLSFQHIGECGVLFQTHERRAPETREMMAAQVLDMKNSEV